MAKAPNAYRTISEVAGELDVQPHVLRFWETKFSQVKPLKRRGGRRYYSSKDIDLLKRIRRLLYGEGYTIKGVQKLLKQRFVDEATVDQDNAREMREVTAESDGQFTMFASANSNSKPGQFDPIVRQEIELIIQDLKSLQADLLKLAS